jgi:ubiquinone/menaquinone biosynthesis C-methylase UbiE
MGSLRTLQKNWEILAQEDPLWAICSDPQKRHSQWNEAEFFATGQQEVEKVLAHVRSLGLSPDASLPALDFGCGVGRLTRALGAHFSESWGVDISPTMIERAREFHRDYPRCRFLVNPTTRLNQLADSYFGFVYTSIVLQHIPPQHARKYLAELLRVLRPGGILVFQAVDRYKAGLLMRLRSRLALRSRI